MNALFSLLLLFVFPFAVLAQNTPADTTSHAPKEYVIAEVALKGTTTLDNGIILSISNLRVGDKIKIPGDAIATAIKNIWKEGFFDDVQVVATKIEGKNIYLEIQVRERPRLSKFTFKGLRKGETDDVKEKLNLNKGKVVTNNLLVNIKNVTQDHFIDKGYINTKVVIVQQKDSALLNSISLFINVKKGRKIKIKEVNFHGNNNLASSKLRRKMKDTKRKRLYTIFNSHTLSDSKYEEDKKKVIAFYNEKGFRDAALVKDTLQTIGDRFIGIDIYLNEGKRYYFRNITWVGNAKYASKDLSKLLGIKKGDVFNQSLLETRLTMNPNGTDISSLYMDDGHLFFQANPVEVQVVGDSIDIEIQIYEGKQATINKVIVKGNIKTNDKVIMRELRTRPGQLFRRSDVMRSQRELSVLGYFDTEKMGINPIPHPENGTVDIEYTLEEKSSDQLELSGGFGQGRVVGSIGVAFNNFSARNLFKRSAWQPLPAGDGQRLSIRGQSNGTFYQSLNMSFTEPWLGGKRPNAFSVTPFVNRMTNQYPKSSVFFGELNIWGLSVGLGRRIKFPDDFFQVQYELNYQYYVLKNYASAFSFTNGFSNDLNLKYTLSRNSVDDIIYPKSGSQVTTSFQFTPPYSLFKGDVNYADMTDQKKYNLLEYYKFKVSSAWYTRLAGKLVMYQRIGFGFLGYYNQKLGITPFQRFYLGGSGLSGYNPLDGREIIALRGYNDQELFNFKFANQSNPGAASIVKYTMEVRYPISLNPSATIFGLAFAEAGNSWSSIKEFNPFNVKRSAGVGLRFFLPMFGMLGFDYGWRFDEVPFKPSMKTSQFHFTIGANMGEL